MPEDTVQVKFPPNRRTTLMYFMKYAISLNAGGGLEDACWRRRGWRYVLASAAIASYGSCRCILCSQRHILRGAQIQQDRRLQLLLPGYMLALSDIGYQPVVRS